MMRMGLMVLWMVGAGALAGPALADGSTTLVIGDSLSAAYGMPQEDGWVARLAERMAGGDDGARVVNASISGDTTVGGVSRLPALLATHTPAAVVIFLGGNDGLRGIAPAVTQKNLEAMIEAVRKAGAAAALIPVRLPPNYGEAYINAFEGMQRQICATTGVPCLDFPWQTVAVEPRYLQEDGLHPNAAAQGVILEALWPGLCRWRAWSACAAEPMPTADAPAEAAPAAGAAP
ncbi:MAG TPA: arylesterase [Gammaproteobacteria bacterium]|nr:arylesterase [Gammaproteobacteria bacterium]